jgi:hypothetical protein
MQIVLVGAETIIVLEYNKLQGVEFQTIRFEETLCMHV